MSRSGHVNTQGTPGRLFALCGLPHAGKSSYANEWVRGAHFEYTPVARFEVTRPRVVIAGDDFRWSALGAEYLAHAEHLIFSLMDTAALALLRRGFDVLIDETSTSKPTLMRYLRMDASVELIFVDTPAEECKRRAVANGRPHLLPVIDRLAPRLAELRHNWPRLREDLVAQIEHRLAVDGPTYTPSANPVSRPDPAFAHSLIPELVRQAT